MTDLHLDALTLLKRDELPEWFSADTKRLISYAAAADIRWGIASFVVQAAWLNARNAAEHDALKWVASPTSANSPACHASSCRLPNRARQYDGADCNGPQAREHCVPQPPSPSPLHFPASHAATAASRGVGGHSSGSLCVDHSTSPS